MAALIISSGCATRQRHAILGPRALEAPATLDLPNLERATAADASTEDAWRRALSGFDAAPPAPVLPVHASGPYGDDRSTLIWWPDLAGHDRALQRVRARYAGQRVWGYGGIAVSCVPAWTRYYTSMTGLRVRTVERKYGVVDRVAGGSRSGAPLTYGLGFLGYAPLSFVVDPPDVKAVAESSIEGPSSGMPGPCPNIVLADFQVETKLSLEPPPSSIGPGLQSLHTGMSRRDVIWIRGYPEELATKAAMLRESMWRYGGAMGQFTKVTFRHDRVVAVDVPPMM